MDAQTCAPLDTHTFTTSKNLLTSFFECSQNSKSFNTKYDDDKFTFPRDISYHLLMTDDYDYDDIDKHLQFIHEINTNKQLLLCD